MRGITKIELTDVNTGKKETVIHKNMVTNAVRDIIQLNPLGAAYTTVDFRNECFPLPGKLLGGIQLFSESLTEDADTYFSPYNNPVTGYASMDVNAGLDTRRGSLNQTESGWLSGKKGYKFVWDFSTSQANGVISAIGLCHVDGGKASAGGQYLIDTRYRLISSNIKILSASANLEVNKSIQSIIRIIPDENCAYSVFLDDQKVIKIKKILLPITEFCLRDGGYIQNADVLDVTTITPNNFGVLTDLTSSKRFYGSFCYDDSGYIWGFQHNNNANGNSSGNAVIDWIKIDVSDWSWQEGTWTISAPLHSFGFKQQNANSTVFLPENNTYCIIHKNALFCLAYDQYGVYKISLDNPTDITLLPDYGRAAGTHSYIRIPGNGDYYRNTSTFNVAGDTIVYSRGHIVDDTVYGLQASSSETIYYGLSNNCAPKLTYGPFLITSYVYASGSASMDAYIRVYMATNYLATINNLSQPVEKTADKTMKITYTIVDDDGDDPDDSE